MVVKWCCPMFQGHYQNAGERTFSVLVDQGETSEPLFVLQHRALEPGDQLPADLNIPVSVVSEVRIAFCPWCGRCLSQWYKKSIPELCRPA